MTIQRIAVLGGGAWGTALAITSAGAGIDVGVWEQEPGKVTSLEQKRESRFLPDVRLHDKIKVTRDLGAAADSDAILIVVPAQAMRSVVTLLGKSNIGRVPLIACAKGIEHGTHKFMTEILAECAPEAVPAILSGPSFAADVARGLPTAVTLAASDGKIAGALAQAIASASFRPYHATDVRGVE